MTEGDGTYNVFCAWFGGTFKRMAAVQRRSVLANCPGAVWYGQELACPPFLHGVKQAATNNAAKLMAWSRAVHAATRPTLCIDADAYVRADLAPVWENDYDVGYCTRPGNKRIIGGALYVQPTEAARAFFREWALAVAELLMDPRELEVRMHQYGGGNQACLAKLCECLREDVRLRALPAAVWNSCDQTWDTFGEQTRVVHLKGALRDELLDGTPTKDAPPSPYAGIVREWYGYLIDCYGEEH